MTSSNRFLSSLLRVGLSGAGAQAVTFLALPLLSRLYSPDDFGVWALVQSSALLLGALATCRYELAVVLPKHHEDAASVLGLGVLLATGVALLAALLISVMGGEALIGVSGPLVWSIPPLIFLAALTQLALAWCTRMGAFSLYGGAQFGLAVLAGALPALMAAQWSDATGLILGTLFANIVINLVLWGWVARQFMRLELVHHLTARGLLAVAKVYRAYPLYMMPYTLLGTVRDRAVYFLLGAYSGAAEVGLYSIAQRLSNAPNSLVASALRPVFFQHALHSSPGKIAQLAEQVMRWLVALVVPPAVFFFFYPEYLLAMVFGAAWASASNYVMILAVSMFPLLLGNWMDRYLDVLGRQRLALAMELIFSVLAVTVLAAVFWGGGSAAMAVACQAGVMAVYFTVWMVVVFRAAQISSVFLLHIFGFAVTLAGVCGVVMAAGAFLMAFTGATLALLLVWPPILYWTYMRMRASWRADQTSVSGGASSRP